MLLQAFQHLFEGHLNARHRNAVLYFKADTKQRQVNARTLKHLGQIVLASKCGSKIGHQILLRIQLYNDPVFFFSDLFRYICHKNSLSAPSDPCNHVNLLFGGLGEERIYDLIFLRITRDHLKRLFSKDEIVRIIHGPASFIILYCF